MSVNRQIQYNKKGFALVVTLSVVVLLTFLIIAFFSSATRDQQETENYSDNTEAEHLASATINLVVGQIREATFGFVRDSAGNAETDSRLAWASQPGMIRTFDSDGQPYRYFKLYSSNEMVVDAPSGSFVDPITSNWYELPGAWTDLNEPVLVEDPDGAITLDATPYRAVYPIVDPGLQSRDATDHVNEVEGFEIAPLTGYDGPSDPGSLNSYNPTASTQGNWAAMPVRWLYMLEDGQIVAPQVSGDDIQINGASTDNPIVARVAFWTDDETAKVNLNTASEGVFWDLPRADTEEERNLGRYQPVRNEFQRFPGHPATTSLSAVFPALDPGEDGISDSEKEERYQTIYSLTPRIQWGGSEAGTKEPRNPEVYPDGGPMGLKTERLLASAGDATYSTIVDDGRREFVALEEKLVELNDASGSSEMLKGISDRGFFLTANSRAPETNLWNMPRISLWPLNTASRYDTSSDDNPRQNPYDKLLKFCSTIGGFDYFFLRANNWSRTFDFNSIPRNEEIYEYLKRLTDANVPGFGESFVNKLGPIDRNALLAQMFDYIRALPDPYNTFLTTRDGQAPYGYTNNSQFGWNNTIYSWNHGGFAAYVAPIQITDSVSGASNGFGNQHFIQQVGIAFRVEGNEDPLATGEENYGGLDDGIEINEATGQTSYHLRAYLYVYCFNPADRFGPYNISNGGNGFGESGGDLRNGVGLSVRLKEYSGFTISADATPGNGSGGGSPDFQTNVPVIYGNSADVFGLGQFPSGFEGPDRNLPPPFNPSNNTPDPYVESGWLMSTNRISLTYDTPLNAGVSPQRQFLNTDLTNIDGGQVRSIRLWPNENFTGTKPDDLYRFSIASGEVTLELVLHSVDANGNPVEEVIQTVNVDIPQASSLIVPNQDFRSLVRRDKNGDPETDKDGNVKNTEFGVTKIASGPLKHVVRRYSSLVSSRALWGGGNINSPLESDDDVGTLALRTVQLSASSEHKGDWRLAFLRDLVPGEWFAPPDAAIYNNPDVMVAYENNKSGEFNMRLVSGVNYNKYSGARGTSYDLTDGAEMSNGAPGDWNNGNGRGTEGALINAPDFGATGRTPYMTGMSDGEGGARHDSYFNSASIVNNDKSNGGTFYQFYTTYSPNRQLHSAMQMGSLLSEARVGSTGYGEPWQTLLFSPNSAAAAAGYTHPGSEDPPDHLLADLFWMPVVDPYPISEPLSTAGKINLNYQIQPFTNIQRRTGMFALLKNMKVLAIPDSDSNVHKHSNNSSAKYRYDIDVDGTLDEIEATVFDQGEIFKSATQISEILLRPEGVNGDLLAWWDTQRMTGDDSREAPYAQLHPRLTTKSNTFRVHYRVQILKKLSGTNPENWQEGRDQVVGEQRGSALVERFIDPNNNPSNPYPDFASISLTDPLSVLDRYYRVRILQRTQFNP